MHATFFQRRVKDNIETLDYLRGISRLEKDFVVRIRLIRYIDDIVILLVGNRGHLLMLTQRAILLAEIGYQGKCHSPNTK